MVIIASVSYTHLDVYKRQVYASVPAIVGRDGIAEIIELHLTPEEQEKFNASCKTMSENYQLSLTL